MSVTCMVFINRSMTGTPYKFAAVPRAGDLLQIATEGREWMVTVENVTFIADGVYQQGETPIQINALTAEHMRRSKP